MSKTPYTVLLSLLLVSCSSIKPNYTQRSNSGDRNIWFKKIVAENKDVQANAHSKRAKYYENKIHNIARTQSSGKFIRDIHTKKVDYWMNYLGNKKRDRFQRFMDNGERYRPIIESIFEKHNLPKELYFVGLIESGYYLGNKSHAGAVGPWQFMRSTGKMFDLKINRFVDERRNIIKATEAAALYYKDLYNIFGSWELALAAYNKGENGIIRRIRRGNTRDYYKLCQMRLLPRETRNYVPKVLAAMKVYSNPSKYGLKINRNPITIYNDAKIIKVKRSLKLRTLAKKLNISLKKLKELNPELIGYYTPRTRKALDIYVPNKEYSSKLLASLINYKKRIPSRRSHPSRRRVAKTDNTYKVRKGDNLTSIAKLFKTSIRAIRKHNRLRRSTIYVGQKLRIPKTQLKTYTVRRGDNLSTIADQFGLAARQLMAMNNLKKATIYPGQKIVIVMR